MDLSAEQPEFRIAVVLSFQQLPLKLLSAYGSELGQTPHFDRMATHGVLFDQHFADDLGDTRSRHAWWDGMTAVRAESLSASSTLSTICSNVDVECHLISDCQPADWDVAPQGWKTTYLENQTDSATDGLGQLIDAALTTIDQLRQDRQSAIVWIHSEEMPGLPIPGMEFLELYLNELPQLAEVEEEFAETSGEEQNDRDDESDQADLHSEQSTLAFGLIEETLSLLSEGATELETIHLKTINVLAAARLSEWDHALGQFYEQLTDDLDAGRMMLLLTSDGGLPLFESQVSQQLERQQQAGPLQEESVHLPLLMIQKRLTLGERVGVDTSCRSSRDNLKLASD